MSKQPQSDKPKYKNIGLGLQLGSEMVAGLVVGIGIGYVLDRWLETKPLFFIIFFILGSITGVWNVIKALKRVQNELNEKND